MNLSWRRIQKIDSADDFSDPLVVVIDDDRQMVCDQTISPQDHEIAGLRFKVLAMSSLKHIDEFDCITICPHPDGEVPALKSVPTGPRVDCPERPSPGLSQVPTRTGAGICAPGLAKLCDDLKVPCLIIVLVTHRPVPLEAVALQSCQNLIDGTSLLPGRINIFDP